MTKNIEVPGVLIPEVDDVTRREFLIGSAVLLLVPAECGSGENGDEASGETRTIEHAMGTTEVPVSPERVVVLDRFATLPNLLALGIEPVASGTISFAEGKFPNVPPSLEGEVEDVDALPLEPQVNIERAALEPDLLIGQDWALEGIYDDLSQIAPTVAIEENYEDYRSELRFAGKVFGMEEKAEELIEDFESRVEEASERLGDIGTVSIAFMASGDIRIIGEGSHPGNLVASLGANLTPDLEEVAG